MSTLESSYNTVSSKFVECMHITPTRAQYHSADITGSTKIIGVDINKAYSSELAKIKKFICIDASDEVQVCSDDFWKNHDICDTTLYYVECEEGTPLLAGSGVFIHELVQKAMEDKLITQSNIKYCLNCSKSNDANGNISNAVHYMFDKTDPALSKLPVNSFIGNLRRTSQKYQTIQYSTNIKDAQATSYSTPMHKAITNSCIYKTMIREDGKILYKIVTDYKSIKPTNMLPIHAQITQMARLSVYNLANDLSKFKKPDKEYQCANLIPTTVKINTDCVQIRIGRCDTDYENSVDRYILGRSQILGGVKREAVSMAAFGENSMKMSQFGHTKLSIKFTYEPTKLEVLELPFKRLECEDRECTKFISWLIQYQYMLIEGFAGVGKSEILKEMTKSGNLFGILPSKILICAPTHAACNKIGGVTLNKAFGVDISGKCNYKINFLNYEMLLCDEISMAQSEYYKKIMFAKIQNPNLRIYCFGDYTQLPPVKEEHIRPKKLQLVADIFKTTVFLKEIFRTDEVELTKLHRHMHDQVEYSQDNPSTEIAIKPSKIYQTVNNTINSINYDIDVNIVSTNNVRKKINSMYMYHNSKKHTNTLKLPQAKELRTEVKIDETNPADANDSKVYWQDMVLFEGMPIISSNKQEAKKYSSCDILTKYDIQTNTVFRIKKINITDGPKSATIDIVQLKGFEHETGDILTIQPDDSFPYIFQPAYGITVHKAQGDTLDKPYCIFQLHKMCVISNSTGCNTAITRATHIHNIYLASPELNQKILASIYGT